MKKRIAMFVLLTLSIDGVFLSALAAGLRTPFGQVGVSGLKIGKSYSIRSLMNRTYELINTGDEPVDISVQSDTPRPTELVSGAQAIPDPGWVSVEKPHFTIGPSQVAKTDLTITIPKDEKFLGKKYLVMIACRTEGKASIQIGLRSRLLLEISSTPPSVDELREKLSQSKYKNLSFDLSPYEAVIEKFPLGVKVDLLKNKNVKLKVINPNDEPLTIHLQPVSPSESQFPVPAGMIPGPEGSILEVGSNGIFKMEGNGIKIVPLSLTIPKNKDFQGKTFFYLVKAEILEQESPTVIYFRLAVKTEE